MPRATVRLQIHAGFDLDAAAAAVGYYAELGVSHYYVSPLQASRAGSTHGYDGIDPTRLDEPRGARPALERLVATLRSHGMGLILDIVPNHLATSMENPWWFDVFEQGLASAHAHAFAIEWHPPEPALRNRVLAPFLPDSPDAMIARGEIGIEWDPARERLMLDAGGPRYPLRESSYAALLEGVLDDPPAFVVGMSAQAFADARGQLASGLSEAGTLEALKVALAGVKADREAIAAIVDTQHYALAHWRDAATRINWRRFFDISELVALRCEDDAVFDAVHALVFDLYADGLIDGVRIDHVDGLAEPGDYCRRLRARLEERARERPDDAPRGRPWIVVEKILAADEALREDWLIDGSTGYEFMDAVSALMHDGRGRPVLEKAWTELGGQDYGVTASTARREVLDVSFLPDFERAARLAAAALEVEVDSIRQALRALVLAYPRYRGYAQPGRVDPGDFPALATAALAALQCAPRPAVCALVALYRGEANSGTVNARAEAMTAFQQLTPPLTARSIEDTAFYRYGRLISRNEVGSEPANFSLSLEAFHARCMRQSERWPASLLATASHDHKRGEDTRMRIASLVDIAADWAEFQRYWVANSVRRAAGAPDAIDISMLLQTLVGIWPSARSRPLPAEFVERVHAWQRKAIRERKQHGTWADPDVAYETAATVLSAALIGDMDFCAAMEQVIGSIECAAAVRGLSQVVMRCTCPGIPDLYQGTDGWDFSLVDPDNRVEVDVDTRLDTLRQATNDADLLVAWRDGRVKQRLLQRLLALRKCRPAVFGGTYRPWVLHGAASDDVVAYVRSTGETHMLIVVPIRPTFASNNGLRLHSAFGDLQCEIPWTGSVRDALTGRTFEPTGFVRMHEVFGPWPVAVLVSHGSEEKGLVFYNWSP